MKQFATKILQKEIEGIGKPELIDTVAAYYDETVLRTALRMFFDPSLVVRLSPPKSPAYADTWLPGRSLTTTGLQDCDKGMMIISKTVTEEDQARKHILSGDSSLQFFQLLKDTGIDLNDIYFTSAFKFKSDDNKPPNWKREIALFFLYHEIKAVNPEYILLLGTVPSVVILGDILKNTRGILKEIEFEFTDKPIKVYTTKDPFNVLESSPYELPGLRADLQQFRHITKTGSMKEIPPLKHKVIQSEEGVVEVIKSIKSGSIVSLDSEWGYDGEGDGWLRGVQLSWKKNEAVFIEVNAAIDDPAEKGEEVINAKKLGNILDKACKHKKFKLIGHNLRSDARIMQDVLRFNPIEYVFHDTMAADHLIECQRPHGLNDCILRDTDLGVYDDELNKYISESPIDEKKYGYGFIPTEVLVPYACRDAEALLRLYEVQDKEIKGKQRELFYNLIMPSQAALLECETTGFKLDVETIKEFTDIFKQKSEEIEQQLEIIAEDYGMEKFNPNSTNQVKELLFDKLGLEPLKTTKAYREKSWSEVKNLSEEEKAKKKISPSTDKVTLTVLRNKHEAVDLMFRYRKIDYQSKNLFKPYSIDENGKLKPEEKSLLGYMDKDGFIRPSVNDTIDTGRRSTRSPNLQNMAGKEVVALYKAARMEDHKHLRSAITSPEKYLFGYADLNSAEMFVMAELSGDENLKKVLYDPAKDFHSSNAILIFNLPYKEEYGDMRKWLEEEVPEGELKRSSAKATGFGWSYGIYPKRLHQDMLSLEIPATVDQCRGWLESFDTKYSQVVEFFKIAADRVNNEGFVENPFGRRRNLYYLADEGALAHQGRAAGNFLIQSTVADLTRSIMIKAREVRDKEKIDARLSLDQHDAVTFYVNVKDVGPFIDVLLPQAFDIPIPQIDLKLDYGIENLGISWSVPDSKEELIDWGVSEEDYEKYGKFFT